MKPISDEIRPSLLSPSSRNYFQALLALFPLARWLHAIPIKVGRIGREKRRRRRRRRGKGGGGGGFPHLIMQIFPLSS